LGLTVGEALQIKPLAGARVLAGSGGLDRVIEYVTVVDAPDAADWLRGGEFVLTTAYSVKDTPEGQVDLIERLIKAGAAGLGIKLRRFIDALSDEALASAERANFPIVELPFEVAWADIITPVLGEVLQRQASVLQRSMDMHTQFIDTVISGGGMGDIAATLSGQIEAPVAIVDARWNVVASVGPPDGLADDIELLSSSDARQARQVSAVEGPWAMAPEMTRTLLEPATPASSSAAAAAAAAAPAAAVAPHSVIVASIGSDGFRYGRLIVREPDDRPLGNMEAIAIGHAVTTATLEALRLKTAQDVERRYRVNFWDDLMYRRFESPADAVKKAKTFDVDLTRPNIVLTVAPDSINGKNGNGGNALPDPVFVRLQDDITQAVARLSGEVLSGRSIVAFPYRRVVSVIAPWMGDVDDAAGARAEAVSLAETIHSYLKAELAPRTVSIGVGRYHRDPMAVAMSYRESSQAVTLGTMVFGPNRVTHFDDMGAYRIMARCGDHAELRGFVQDHLGEIISYDEARGTELVPTLEAFLEEGCNAQAAADRLFVHVNTLKYRLSRVERLAGIDLAIAETRFNLGLALRIRRYLKAVSQ
jgi:purine catabolism regulator